MRTAEVALAACGGAGEEKNAGNEDRDKQSVVEVITFIADQVDEMIYREENILFPMLLHNLTEDEWLKIAHESDDFLRQVLPIR
jgi:DUF438 domain-containing protein